MRFVRVLVGDRLRLRKRPTHRQVCHPSYYLPYHATDWATDMRGSYLLNIALNCFMLVIGYCSDLSFDDNNLTGTLPNSIGVLTDLVYVIRAVVLALCSTSINHTCILLVSQRIGSFPKPNRRHVAH